VAHSVSGEGGGYGFMVVNDPSDSGQSSCFEGTKLYAYKNIFHGAYYAKGVRKVIFHKSVMIDNGLGIGG